MSRVFSRTARIFRSTGTVFVCARCTCMFPAIGYVSNDLQH